MNIAIASLAIAAGAAAAQANLIAHWNFNGPGSAANSNANNLGTVDTTVSSGAGSIALTGLTMNTGVSGNTNGNVGSFSGNTLNAVSGDVAGFSLTVTGGLSASGSAVTANGGALIFTVDNSSATSDLVLTYATRGTGSGFNNQAWDFSTDGGTNWTPLTSFSGALTSTWVARTVTFPTTGAAYGINNLMVRLTLTGATGNTGNNRFDNVQFNALPTPGSAALLSVGLVAAGRRRRA